ncbi:hypothetical protein [Terriglobus sp.]|uniref:hypothetical protein n=1 Tax=Terriglobus sp. TaxID=1889013 RepID=UPI003AFF7349
MRLFRARTGFHTTRQTSPARTRFLLCAFAMFAALGCRTAKRTEATPLSTAGWRSIRSGRLAVKVPPGTTVETSISMVRGVYLSVESYKPGQTWQSVLNDFTKGTLESSGTTRNNDASTTVVLPTPAGQACHRSNGGQGQMGLIACVLQLPHAYVQANLPITAPDQLAIAEQTIQQVVSHILPAPVRDGDFAFGNNEAQAGVQLPPDTKSVEHGDIVLNMLLPVEGTSRTSNMQVNLNADSPDPLMPHKSLLRDSADESAAAAQRGDPVDKVKRLGHRTVAGLPGEERVTVISASEPDVSPMECRWQFFGDPNKPTPPDVTMRAVSPAALNNFDYNTNLRAWDAILDSVHLQ